MLKIVKSLFLLCLLTSSSLFSQDQLDLIIDADTGNEVDDPYALSRALIEPTWNILALNATHWQTSHWAIEETMENSHRLNQMILGYLGRDIKTRRGGVARMYDWGDLAQHSAAAYEIIQQAERYDSSNKLNIIALGALTNIASAIYIKPTIAEKIKLHWLGTSYDFENQILSKNDFNCVMDIQALDLLLKSKVELHIIPVNVASQMVFDFQETQAALQDIHPLGNFLLKRWEDHLDGGRMERVIWDLALVSSILYPEWAERETVITSKDNGQRPIHYIKKIEADKMKAEFFMALEKALQKD